MSHRENVIVLEQRVEVLQEIADRRGRQQEIIVELAFSLGHKWASMDHLLCAQVMDNVEGSFGLYSTVIQWAKEFDREWEARTEDQKENFLEDIDDFFQKKFEQLIKSVRGHNGHEPV